MILFSLPAAHAENAAILSGNAILPPQTIERIIRSAIAYRLKGDIKGSGIHFKTEGVDQEIEIKQPSEQLKQIMFVLGLKSPLNIVLPPIDVGLTLPSDGLSLSVKSTGPNHFNVKATWSISALSAEAKYLKIKVPKGIFDQAFEIVSGPLEISLAPGSPGVQIELLLTADLLEKGTEIHLQRLTTNLDNTNGPALSMKLGVLLVNGKPLEVQISSNGQTITADEPSIRKEFQSIEPNITRAINTRLTSVIEEHFKTLTKDMENSPPLKLSLDANKILEKATGQSTNKTTDQPVLKELFHDMNIDFMFSYLQALEHSTLFSAQLTSHVCFNQVCLEDTRTPSPINSTDLKSMQSNDDIGILIYESWLQTIMHSDPFETRFKAYFLSQQNNKGTWLGDAGVRVHFKPEQDAIAVVLNLEIDIKKTGKEGSPWYKKLNLLLGDAIERYFGSGKLVKLPVEITARIQSIEKLPDDTYALHVSTELPFKDDLKILNTFHYPCNVDDMTGLVRKTFLNQVKEDISALVPPQLTIPLGESLDYDGMNFSIRGVKITPNHGLLITGNVKE